MGLVGLLQIVLEKLLELLADGVGAERVCLFGIPHVKEDDLVLL